MPNLENVIDKINAKHGMLFILCGYPYAGKSYVARQLLAQTDIVSVSIDDIFHAKGFDWDTNKLPNAQEWEDIFIESYAKTKEILEKGQNVLYDSTNHTVASRDRLREVAREAGADAYVIYIQTSLDNVWKRWEASAASKDRHVVSRDLVVSTIESFEPPASDENVLLVEN